MGSQGSRSVPERSEAERSEAAGPEPTQPNWIQTNLATKISTSTSKFSTITANNRRGNERVNNILAKQRLILRFCGKTSLFWGKISHLWLYDWLYRSPKKVASTKWRGTKPAQLGGVTSGCPINFTLVVSRFRFLKLKTRTRKNTRNKRKINILPLWPLDPRTLWTVNWANKIWKKPS